MSLKTTLTLCAYVLICLFMCAFILANEDNESLGNPSPIAVVRSTQKGSIIEYIIWSFAVLFFITCIILNRFSNLDSPIASITSSVKAVSRTKEHPKSSGDKQMYEQTLMEALDQA